MANKNTKIIKNLYFDLTTSGKIVSKITTTDMLETDIPLEIYGDEEFKYLLFSKTVGDEIIVFKKGNWWNIEITEEKIKASVIIKNILNTLKFLKDDGKIIISKDEAKNKFLEYIELIKFFKMNVNNDYSHIISEENLNSFINSFNRKYILEK